MAVVVVEVQLISVCPKTDDLSKSLSDHFFDDSEAHYLSSNY